MKIEPRTLQGFMELLPKEQILFNKLKDIIRETYESYGFLPLDTPVIEYSDVLLAKAGGETEKQIYRFNKGDNDLSLRFDLTVPLSKFVAKNSNNLVFPFKRYQIGKVYRGERPQKGRFREFYQCDIDVIGEEELPLIYDAEIPSVIYDVFKKMNIGNFVIRINNRKLLNGLFQSLELKDSASDILRIVDKLEKIGEENVVEELLNIQISKEKIERILSFVKISGTKEEKIQKLRQLNIENEMFNQGIYEIETVINQIGNMGVPSSYYDIDFTIARGLDYYTGTVYETVLCDYPGIGSICSGGRYENLAEHYTKKKLPGVGISIGLSRLFYQLNEAKIISAQTGTIAKVMILPMTEDYNYVMGVARILRENNIPVDVCHTGKAIKNKFRYADRLEVEKVVVIGDDEVQNNQVTIKNMRTGNQEIVTKDELVQKITSI